MWNSSSQSNESVHGKFIFMYELIDWSAVTNGCLLGKKMTPNLIDSEDGIHTICQNISQQQQS